MSTTNAKSSRRSEILPIAGSKFPKLMSRLEKFLRTPCAYRKLRQRQLPTPLEKQLSTSTHGILTPWISGLRIKHASVGGCPEPKMSAELWQKPEILRK